jgi:acyl-CoA synthetase (NDP forming)
LNTPSGRMRRLLSPLSIAFIGGDIAELAIRRSREIAYAGEIWPVHPKRESLAGIPCYGSVEDLPGVPDAAYIAVNRELTIATVATLSAIGAGGCVCYAAGYSEMGEEGEALQRQLVAASGDMPLVGPNCFGTINFLDHSALWPYLFGGGAVERGPALISQSGNIAMNLTMNQRSVHFAYVIATGNQAVLGPADFINALLDDDRVTAIGMYMEGLPDIESFSRAALRALEQRVPIVVMKVGKTEASARRSSSHTSSLTGSDVLHDALFERLGVVRVDSLNQLLESLKVLQYAPPLRGNNIFSLSCSGGEAAIMADLAPEHGLRMEPFSAAQMEDLNSQFTNYVTVSNPFDYNTSIWGDGLAQERCFTSSMQGDHNAALLIYDHPSVESPEVDEWVIALDAFSRAHQATTMPAFVVCTLSELLPPAIRERLLAKGVVPLQGLDDALAAVSAAVRYQALRDARPMEQRLPGFATGTGAGETRFFDEAEGKRRLQEYGLTVPPSAVGSARDIPGQASELGYPVVVKALGEAFLHKSELGAVQLELHSEAEVRTAVSAIQAAAGHHGLTAERFLVEHMVTDVVAELIVGVKRDQQFGPALVIGSGGLLVELLADSASLLLPVDEEAIVAAIGKLGVNKLLRGFRGKPAGDMSALVDAVLAIARFVEAHWDTLEELDVNPLMVLREGRGVVAVDVLVGFAE